MTCVRLVPTLLPAGLDRGASPAFLPAFSPTEPEGPVGTQTRLCAGIWSWASASVFGNWIGSGAPAGLRPVVSLCFDSSSFDLAGELVDALVGGADGGGSRAPALSHC